MSAGIAQPPAIVMACARQSLLLRLMRSNQFAALAGTTHHTKQTLFQVVGYRCIGIVYPKTHGVQEFVSDAGLVSFYHQRGFQTSRYASADTSLMPTSTFKAPISAPLMSSMQVLLASTLTFHESILIGEGASANA
ncbi:hypothetical protein [Sphingomonas sp. PAMC 26617]|uniref:hypothetical protein n=1 Tax=Sphingomonas sp. PAMC 26617 TaxID=1112216 RepID=UPI0012F4A3C6|nr:hypothetical protein [Sphingomonas sp. PAMC 26617]